MYYIKYIVIALAVPGVLFISSCHSSQHKKKLLSKAQDIVEENPQKALMMLDSIKDPLRMDEDSYMQYIVAMVQAKYKCYKDISKDSLILGTGSYFEKNQNYRQAALAYFYSGGYYKENKQEDNALSVYFIANINAQKTDDNRLKGMIAHNIGDLYYLKDVWDLSMVFCKRAVAYFGDENCNKYFKQQSLNRIGRIYSKQGNLDSAYYYFNSGLQIANEMNNKPFQFAFLNNIGVILKDQNKLEDSEQYFRKAFQYAGKTEDSLSTYLNLVKIFYLTNERDSTTYYLETINAKLKKIESPQILFYTYMSLVDYNRQIGNLEEALKYEKLKGEVNVKIIASKNTEKLMEASNQFQLSLKEKEIENQRSKLLLFGTIGFIFLVSILFFVRRIQQKTKIQRERNRLLEQKNSVLEKEKTLLLETQKLLNEKVESLVFMYVLYRNIIQEWSKIENEVDTLVAIYECEKRPEIFNGFEKLIDNMKQTSEIQIIEWSKDYLKQQQIDTDVVDKLKVDDLLLLSLCYCKTKDEDIAPILGIPLNTVNRKKLYLERKLQKLNIIHKDEIRKVDIIESSFIFQ